MKMMRDVVTELETVVLCNLLLFDFFFILIFNFIVFLIFLQRVLNGLFEF